MTKIERLLNEIVVADFNKDPEALTTLLKQWLKVLKLADEKALFTEAGRVREKKSTYSKSDREIISVLVQVAERREEKIRLNSAKLEAEK